MFKNIKLLRVVIQFLAVTVPLVLRCLSVFADAGGAVNYAYYAVVFTGALWFAADMLSNKEYSNSFDYNKANKMNMASYALAFGFFAEFLNCCLSVSELFSEREYIAGIFVFIHFYTAFCALLSSVYLIIVGMTCSGRYDFRYLKVMHLLPLLWVSGKMLELLLEAGVTSVEDTNSVIGFLALTFALCFFYSFAREVENTSGAKRATAMLSAELAYFSLLSVCNTVLNIAQIKEEGVLSLVLTAVTFTTLFLFSFMFNRSISVNNINTEN